MGRQIEDEEERADSRAARRSFRQESIAPPILILAWWGLEDDTMRKEYCQRQTGGKGEVHDDARRHRQPSVNNESSCRLLVK